ncbi:hypothetical protein CHELA1G11_60050 [Hyphomicrobiales bacterium]|nr:hypothetical protein CHELA1G11_60050 [Hyphomicrobiales bacterium]
MCVFVYEVDTETEPASARRPMQFTEVYLAQVEESDFRRNARSTDKGTRTATLHAQGVAKLRLNWIYKTESIAQKKRREAKERRDAESAAKKAAKLAARAGAKRTAKKP